MRLVKPQPRLPREAVDVPSLKTSQARLDRALSNLTQLKMSLLMAGGLGWMASEGPFQPKALCDSMHGKPAVGEDTCLPPSSLHAGVIIRGSVASCQTHPPQCHEGWEQGRDGVGLGGCGELSPHRRAVWTQGERIRLQRKEIRNFWRRNRKEMLGQHSRYLYSQPCQAMFCWRHVCSHVFLPQSWSPTDEEHASEMHFST